ncbi:MAG: ferric reductase-like transmembrane domain-containing protein, partial [Planctomycetes bacterium]|nr:ferric reductase-like transmembrane domain-containing protein [Planctomycetota bacterium]
ESIKFHALLILLPILRNSFTGLRHFFRTHAFPLEHPVGVHKYLGHALFTLTLFHIAGYTSYYATLHAPFIDILLGKESDLVRTMNTNMYEFVTFDESIDIVDQWTKDGFPKDVYENKIRRIMWDDCTDCHSVSSTMTEAYTELPLSTYEQVVKLGGKGYGFETMSRKAWVHLTGIITFLSFAILWFFSLSYLRKHYHHLFYLTHYLFIVWFIGIMVHAPATIYWCTIPCGLFLIDKILHFIYRRKKTKLLKTECIGSDIIVLDIERPSSFKYNAGDVIFICLPELSRYEWHPFTMSSAPAAGGNITLHIRNLGDWTEKLYLQGEKAAHQPILMHGPYNTPTLHILKSQVPVLISTGIGATPFAAILKEWIALNRQNKTNTIKSEKLIFIWVYRDADAYLWMQDLLKKCNIDDYRDSLEIRLFLTRPQDREAENWISEPCIRGTTGRPNWAELFQEIVEREALKSLDIYYCGVESVALEIEELCKHHHLSIYRERF